MLIHVKQTFEVRNDSGDKFSARNGDLVSPPDWVIHNDYFKALCDSGKINIHLDARSAEVAIVKEAEEKNKKNNPKK